jgi:FkbM family methyltransferase
MSAETLEGRLRAISGEASPKNWSALISNAYGLANGRDSRAQVQLRLSCQGRPPGREAMQHRPARLMIDRAIALVRPFRFRGKYRLLNRFAPNEGIRDARCFGLQFELDLADWIQRSIYLGTYEPLETGLVAGFLTLGMTVVDVGANVGYYTALAASKVGSKGRIFAIEPDAWAFRQLENLIAKNHLPVCAVNIGLGERSGVVEHLYQAPDSRNNTPTMVAHGGYAPKATVRIRSLDDCLDEWQVDHVDLLKIDAQGWEPQVFAGASRSLAAGRIDAILCEFNDHWLRAAGSSAQGLWKTLMSLGFHPTHDVDVDRLPWGRILNCLLVR